MTPEMIFDHIGLLVRNLDIAAALRKARMVPTGRPPPAHAFAALPDRTPE